MLKLWEIENNKNNLSSSESESVQDSNGIMINPMASLSSTKRQQQEFEENRNKYRGIIVSTYVTGCHTMDTCPTVNKISTNASIF